MKYRRTGTGTAGTGAGTGTGTGTGTVLYCTGPGTGPRSGACPSAGNRGGRGH